MAARDEPPAPRRHAHAARKTDRADPKLEHSLAPHERAPQALPHRERMETLFRAELTQVRAYTGAATTLAAFGARAAADGDRVAFAEAQPSAATVAHEVTHVLQARRTGGGGDAEAEASGNQATVVRGSGPVSVSSPAAGMHFELQENWIIGGASFIDQHYYMLGLELGSRLERLEMLDASPVGKYVVERNESRHEANNSFALEIDIAIHLTDDDHHPSATLGPLVAPDTLDGLVTNGAGGGGNIPGAQLGVTDAIYWNIVNALARRAIESLPRVLPYVAHAKRGVEWMKDADSSEIPVAHPMDRVVAKALCSSLLDIDSSYYKDHGDEVKAPPAPPRQTIEVHPAGGELWHWVIAKPADATPQEVALAMFGNADLAYLLTPMPPRWGFHHDDLAKMKPELREAIHQYAREHHPPPLAVLNPGEVFSHRDPVPVAPRNFDHCGTVFKDPSFELSRHILGEDQRVEPPGPAPIYGLPRGVDDPVLELTRAERVPLPEAPPPGKHRGDNPQELHDELELSEELADADRLLGQIVEGIHILGLPTDTVVEVRDWLATRRMYAVKHFLGNDVDRWYRLTAEQIPILRTAAYGMANLLLQLASYAPANVGGKTPGDGLIQTLPPFTRDPLQDAARAYVQAVQAIDLPAVARERARVADDLARNVTITTLERGLAESARGNDVSMAQNAEPQQGPDPRFIDPFKQYDKQRDAAERLAKLRLLQVSDPETAAREMAALREEVGDFQFTIAIEQAIDQLNAYWQALDDANDFWTTLTDTIRTDILKNENRFFYTWFRDAVWKIYKIGTQPAKELARNNFKWLIGLPRWKQHFKDVEDLIQDEASHRRWMKLIAAITIAIVSLAVGGEVGAFAIEELGWSAGAATAANVAADTLTSTVLNYSVLGVKPTIGSTVAQIVTFGGMAALNRVRAVARAAGVAEEAEEAIKASFLARAGRATVDFAKEAFLNVAMGQAANALGNRIDTGSWIDADNAPEAFVDGAITAVALTIAGRLHNQIMEPRFRKMAAGFGVDLDGVYNERVKLIDEATKLKGSTDRDAALDVVDRLNENLEREQELRKRLVAISKLHPKAFKDAMGDLTDLANVRANRRELQQARAIIGTEDLGPGLARADRRELDAILAEHRENGGHVTKVETDPNTNLRTITIETAGGTLEIREKPLPAHERTPPALATDTAREFERWLDDPTRDPVAAQRLRDLYVIDPEAAVALAKDHGYQGAQPEHPVADEATRAREDARKLDDPHVRELTNPDFSALERAGYRYDPVARRFVPIATTRSGVHPDAHLGARVNEVIGKPLPSVAVGKEVLQLLAMGDAHALRVAGIEPPAGFESGRGEWGLGRRTSDGAIVLVRGEAMGVEWGNLPGIEPLAHSHPFRENKYFQIGGTPEGKVALADLVAGHYANDALKLFPSGADFMFCAAHGLESHLVYTPYVDLGNGMIGNPRPGGLETPITIEIRNARQVGTESATGAPTASAEVIVRAGDKELMRRQMWGGALGNYMPIRFQAPPDLVFGPVATGPTGTSAPIAIDREALATAADDPRVNAELKQAIHSDPRVQVALHNEGYDPTTLIDAWNDFREQRSPSRVLESKTFGEYLKNRRDFHTSNESPPTTLAEKFPHWGTMELGERQRAILELAEPELAKALERRGKLPSKIKRAINHALNHEDLLGKTTSWDGGRHNVMTAIDDIIARLSDTPAELAQSLEVIGGSGRIGTIGEQYVTNRLSIDVYAENDLSHPRFAASEIPGLQDAATFSPDRIVRDAHRSLDIKTGYGDTKIDPVQARNYDRFIQATETPGPLQDRVGGPLEGHDYLFLPGGSVDPAKVAVREYGKVAKLSLRGDFRVLYLGSDGVIYQYLPSGARRLGTTIHQAMGLKPP